VPCEALAAEAGKKKKKPPEGGFFFASGGASRSRTGLHGFAGRCITALLSRQKRTADTRGLLAPATTGQICSLARSTNEACQTKREALLPRYVWSGRRVSNSRPQPWQGCALPTELLPHFPALYCYWLGALLTSCKTPHQNSGAGDESRTRDLNLGKVALYQLSYSRVLLQTHRLSSAISTASACFLLLR
jgi:hypothetical protein